MRWFYFMKNRDIYFMNLAISEAKKAIKEDEVPVGAVLVLNDKVIAKAHNKTNAHQNNFDHAEMLVIAKALKKLGVSRLDDATIYVTLEPCLMCAGAIYLHKIKKVIFALRDDKFGALVSTNNVYESKQINFTPEIELGPLGEEAKKLLNDFFATKRK